MASKASKVETTLSLSEQPAQIDKDTSVELTVTTNADTYTVELDNDNVQYEKKDNNVLKLTGKKVGTTEVKVIATANNGTEKNIIWYTKVIIIPTTLEVTNNPSELNLGEKVELDITTNATSYTITSSNPDVIKVGSKPNEIIASSLGNTRMFLRATKQNAEEKVIEWDLAVKYVKPVTDKGTASTIKLCNTNTKRIVTLATTDNESAEDITVSLPRSSGTLITEESLQTTSRIIQRPFIMQPAAGSEFFTGKFIASDFEAGMGYKVQHDKSVWQVARDAGFKHIVMEKEVIPETVVELQEDAIFKRSTTKTKPLTETVLNIIGTFYVRVKYFGGDFESDWSGSVYVNLGINALHDVKTPIKVYNHPESGSWTAPRGLSKLPSWYDGAYFGIVPHSSLVKDYDFRGTFNTIKNAFDPNKYTDPSGATEMIKMRKGYQVIHDKKLWYALEEMANASKDAMIVPGTDGNKWKEDLRTALGSPSVVHDMIGIGHGIVDNNHNQMSNGGTSIGPLVNHEDGYIKYVYNGKLCYTTPKPTCNSIAWTDIAQRELAHQQKTIRLGQHLFKVRLFEEDEYKALMDRMINGTYDTKTSTELELSKKVWLHDRQTGSARKVAFYGAPLKIKGAEILGNYNSDKSTVTNSNRPAIKIVNNYTKIKVGEEVDLGVSIDGTAGGWAPDTYLLIERDQLVVNFEETISSRDKNMISDANRFTGKITGVKPGKNTIDIVAYVSPDDSMGSDPEKVTTIQYTVEVVPATESLQVTTLDPKSRTGSYRYVLEYIPEECAPYNNIISCFGANIPKAVNEDFRYDPYTDVGFFGVVRSDDLIRLDTLSNRVGFTSGTAQHPDAGFLKFYWHGMMIFIAKKPPRYNVSWNQIKSHNCQYGWDMGNNDSKFLDIGGVSYRCSNILGARKSPFDHTKISYSGNKISHSNVLNENYKYSQWGECIIRLADVYVGYEEVSPTTFNDQLCEIGGLQIGDHFQKMATTEIIVRGDRDGNGPNTISREVGSGTYTSLLGGRGFGLWFVGRNLTFTASHTSWRPVLMLDAKY